MTEQTIKIADIKAEDRVRPVEEAVVEAYAGIAEERVALGQSPLIQPIVVRPFDDHTYELISGAHRLAALLRIGRTEVEVGADVIVRDEDAVAARGSEIMENLARADMTALDRAIFIHEAKNIFVNRQNSAGGRPRKDTEFKEQKNRPESGLFSSARFTKEIEKRLGLGRTQVLEADQLAAALKSTPDVIAELRGTMQADNAQELKALAELDPDMRRKAVSAIRGGQAKTVREARVAIGLDKKVEPDPQHNWLLTLQDIWANKLDRKHKAKFLADNGLVEAGK